MAPLIRLFLLVRHHSADTMPPVVQVRSELRCAVCLLSTPLLHRWSDLADHIFQFAAGLWRVHPNRSPMGTLANADDYWLLLAPHSGSFTRFEHFALVSRRGAPRVGSLSGLSDLRSP